MEGIEKFKRENHDLIVIDTSGRHVQEIPEELIKRNKGDRWTLESLCGNGLELLGGSSFKEDKGVWLEVGRGIVRARVVSSVVVWLESVLGNFLGGFLVDELALEAMRDVGLIRIDFFMILI
uniref:Uncharacterized protein n=1 Tax=Tanacetum cinerariifolium TaxID=118510 RepID=A0A699GHV2_TANCI|nr:hypothetical protein [Tanacetum cinerariifolium]